MYEITKVVQSLNSSGDFRLCEMDTDSIANNVIPSNTFITFAANGLDTTIVQTALNTKLAEIKTKYTDETNAKLTISTINTTPTNTIKGEGSAAIIDFIASLFCGRGDEEGNYVKNANISPVKLEIDTQSGNGIFTMSYKPRAYKQDELDQFKADLEYSLTNLQTTFPNTVYEPISDYPPWMQDEDNPFVKTLIEGFDNAGIEPKVAIISGGIEPTIWYSKQNALNMGSIGPTVLNAHNVTETIYLDTINPLVKILLYTIDQLTK